MIVGPAYIWQNGRCFWRAPPSTYTYACVSTTLIEYTKTVESMDWTIKQTSNDELTKLLDQSEK